jgi:hypothetical protein
MLLITFLTGCIWDSHNPKYEEEYDFRCTDQGEAAFVGQLRFSSIQDAINEAGSGETVEVCPGQYDENIVVEQNIRIEGRTTSGNVVIQGDGSDSVVLVAEGATLRGLIIQGGGGFLNEGQTLGGGLLLIDGVLDAKDVTFRGNTADLGGGAYVQGEAVLEDVRFLQNDANQTAGGAVFVGNTELIKVDFQENTAQAGGGFGLASGSLTMSSGSFLGNTADVGTAFALFNDAQANGAGVDIQLADGDAVLLQTNDDSSTFPLQSGDFSCATTGGSLRCDSR